MPSSTTSVSHMDAPSSLFTSTHVHVVPGLDKQTDNHVQPGQTCTNQAVFSQECAGSTKFEQVDSIQENSGHANSGHLELSPAIELQSVERCAQTEHVDPTYGGEHGANVDEVDVTSTEVGSSI
ncbi:hypothetical protein V6N13_072921 [Hibiscus sabdariffa]|uniref:Uncharacterized protein n=1 Tax=Hibiscus sabdariffa TaxID=183260 RepID=A0ABR2E937_9ROSI